MADMLVRLYDLPMLQPLLDEQARQGITIRQAMAVDRGPLLEWIGQDFSGWAQETAAAFKASPPTCHVAETEDGKLIGFACHDVTAPNFFGPTAVDEACRGRGTGKALLLATLHAQKAQGYGYAIIGGVGPADFYAHTVDAIDIPGSTPGIYGELAGDSDQ